MNDRVLCGYNRNIGKPSNDADSVGLSGGCRIRGGRLECGYEQGPFNNLRRPPAWNYQDGVGPHGLDDPDIEYIYYDDNHGTDKLNIHKLSKRVTRKVKLSKVMNATKREKLLNGLRAVTKCVEIKDRIVCKQV